MAYSRKPLCKAIELNVPIHPLSFLSTPVSQVTNRGLKRKNDGVIYKIELNAEQGSYEQETISNNQPRGKPTTIKEKQQYVDDDGIATG